MRSLGKRNVLGVLVDGVDMDAAVEKVMRAAREPRPYSVTALAVHGVMTGVQDVRHRARLNRLDLVVPDGQPVRFALNLLYRAGLSSPVRGTDLTRRLLASAEAEQLPVFFYGSTRVTLDRLTQRLKTSHPDLVIAGSTPSAFTAVGSAAQDALAAELKRSQARIVFVGLGCPRQEVFVSAMAARVGVPMIAVGAAFDYLAGNLADPPQVVRRWGLEWAWRLVLEPRRLWRRYVLLNPVYLTLLAFQATKLSHPDPVLRPIEPTEWLDA